METGIVPRNEALAAVRETASQARDYAAHARAENTVRAYRSDWRDWCAWCDARSCSPLPADPETVALYLTERIETAKVSTLQRRLCAISQAHQLAGHPSPTKHPIVRAVWAGIRRVHGTAQAGKAPTLTEDLRRMVETLGSDLAGVRDRALLLVGFAGAFRRSELVSLDREDVTVTRSGLVLHLRRSKTDQEGQGSKKGIPHGSAAPTCPVRSLQAWMRMAGIESGPLFRGVTRHGQLQPGRLSDRAVALVVKRAAAAAGLDPDLYSGHSLRAGLATSAAAAGASERAIMAQTGHKSVQMVRRYIRDGSLFRENAAGQVGL
ncbi:MAG: site-specific integrase [Armatimonadota bacterium]